MKPPTSEIRTETVCLWCGRPGRCARRSCALALRIGFGIADLYDTIVDYGRRHNQQDGAR